MVESAGVTDKRLVVAITGASGAAYARRLLQVTAELYSEVYVTMTAQAVQVAQQELLVQLDADTPDMELLLGAPCPNVIPVAGRDYFSPPASGSFRHDGMVVVPCSMGTLGRIANGISNDLITRAADVCLKERRKLILVPRESPVNLVQLRNMTAVTEAGAVVLPASPGFYNRPTSVDDLVDHVVDRILMQLGVSRRLSPEWQHPNN
ncbi:MAG: UbiX family flavin prenyltransferase [Armatimonadetes bacterium]|nr:UbiX family flavin prenyltransferase [Armatimonadota bacterium]MDE2207927.1 UbiX family flavin prenyltransferase [Armatimonadota bacterium]